MAKRKKKKQQTKAVSASVGGGIAAGAATFLAGQAVKAVVKEVVEAGTDRFLFRRGRGKSKGPDAGLLILRTLADAPPGEPVTVVRLVRSLELQLLDVADLVRGLRRLRLAKYVDGRRAVRLTGQGRELLEELHRAPEEGRPGIAADPGATSDSADEGQHVGQDDDGDEGGTEPDADGGTPGGGGPGDADHSSTLAPEVADVANTAGSLRKRSG